MVISLGATRTLNVGKTAYQMHSGDLIMFGSDEHGVPREPQVLEGRISIATFMVPFLEEKMALSQPIAPPGPVTISCPSCATANALSQLKPAAYITGTGDCVICLEMPSEILFEECMHMCVCAGCCEAMVNKAKK